MLKRNPEYIAVESRESERGRRRGRQALASIALGMSLVTGVGAFSYDVQTNKAVQATSSPTVEVILEPAGPMRGTALVFLHGFGTIGADPLARYIGPAAQEMVDGEAWSVGYDNAHLDERVTAHKIVTQANERGVTHVQLVGYSGGFIMATKIARIIAEESSLQVVGISGISAPDGLDTVREEHVEAVELLNMLEMFPDLAYSTPVRKLGELAFRSDRYLEDGQVDVETLWRTWNEINEVVDTNKLPGTWLMLDQLALIETADIAADLQAIVDASPTRLRPVISYFGTAQPGFDAVVDDARAAQAICGYAHKAGMDCHHFVVPGAVHMRIDVGTEAYREVFAQAKAPVQASMEAAERERRLAIGGVLLRRGLL
jgi:pimeloyl-ACP methyl ester carboxylesterase